MHSVYKLKLDLPPKNPILADTCKSTSPTKGVRIEHAHTEYWLGDVLVVLHNGIILCIIETAGFYLQGLSIINDAFSVHLLPVSAFSSAISNKTTTAQHACVARSKSVPAPRRIALKWVGASRGQLLPLSKQQVRLLAETDVAGMKKSAKQPFHWAAARCNSDIPCIVSSSCRRTEGYHNTRPSHFGGCATVPEVHRRSAIYILESFSYYFI